jgi:hypothetical protein
MREIFVLFLHLIVTLKFQTPRVWNPRATFSLHEGKHFLKFGFEFLKVQTEINDLNATIGAMGFVNRFTGRAIGDSLPGAAIATGSHVTHADRPGPEDALLLPAG